jgi:hypothetical protein
MQDTAKHDSQPGAGLGQVDIFDLNGNFVNTFVAAGGHLNAPWGIAEAPNGFGSFSNPILVGNFGDGTINAYDTTGRFLGQLTDASNHALVNPGLWEIEFGGGGLSGDPGTLYLTAGGSNQPNFPQGGTTTAVFASVVPAAAANADFSFSLSSQSATVAPSGSTSLTINAGAVGGFNGQIDLSCVATPGLTCAFNPTTISPGANGGSSTLTVSAAAAPPSGGGYTVLGTVALLPGLGVIGTVLANRRRKRLIGKSILSIGVLGLLLAGSFFAVGCSSSVRGQMATPQQVTLMVTGKSGTLSHTAPVTITIQ